MLLLRPASQLREPVITVSGLVSGIQGRNASKGLRTAACGRVMPACNEFVKGEDADRAGDRVSMSLHAFQNLSRYLAQRRSCPATADVDVSATSTRTLSPGPDYPRWCLLSRVVAPCCRQKLGSQMATA